LRTVGLSTTTVRPSAIAAVRPYRSVKMLYRLPGSLVLTALPTNTTPDDAPEPVPYSDALPSAFEQESRADEQHRDCDTSRKNCDDCEQRANGSDKKDHAKRNDKH